MSEHTKEPWEYDFQEIGAYAGPGSSGQYTTVVGLEEHNRGYESFHTLILSSPNARRICAAVNACAGIPTEALEAGAMREMVEALGNIEKGCSFPDDAVQKAVRDVARAVLVKVRP